jgi:hypothetical protein
MIRQDAGLSPPAVQSTVEHVRLERRRKAAFAGLPPGATLLPTVTVFCVALFYFVKDIDVREASLLESQDLGIACELFRNFSISADHSPLHFVFMNAWQRLNPHSIAFMRFPAALFCAMSALVVYALAEREAGRVAGVLAAAFLMTNPLVVENARSMRLYSMVLLLAATCLWFFRSYLVSKRRLHLAWLVISSVLAIYTHLFLWLLVAPLLLLLLVDHHRNLTDKPQTPGVLRWVILLGVLLVPQVIHGIAAIGLTRERHALYQGLASNPTGFLVSIGQMLFFGEGQPRTAIGPYAVLFPFCLLALGILALKKSGLVVAGALILPAIGASWILSFSSPIEPRYLIFLVPLIATLMALGLAQATNRYKWMPAGIATLGWSIYVTHVTYSEAASDWYDAANQIEALKRSDRIVAVFPGYWDWTLRLYGHMADTAPVTFPIDLDRVLARGKPVLLVRNSGRYFGNMAAFLKAHTKYREVYKSQVRDTLSVYSVIDARSDPPATETGDTSVLLTGVIGSGGYAWQFRQPDADPLVRLRGPIESAGLVLGAYEPQHPPWYARLLLGARETELLLPNLEVAQALKRGGINAVVLSCQGVDCEDGADALTQAGLRIIPFAFGTGLLEPHVFRIAGGSPLVVLAVRGPDAGDPSCFLHASALPSVVESAILHAKDVAGARGHVLVIIPQPRDYGRMATESDGARAKRMIDLGADLVVGEGGYAVKELEEYKGGLIAYSLGSLLRSAALSLSTRDSTGIALRVSWPEGKKLAYQAIPLTFDNAGYAALGRPKSLGALVRSTESEAEMSLADHLVEAECGYETSDGRAHNLGPWRAETTDAIGSFGASAYDMATSLTRWFPLAPETTRLRPSYGGYAADGAYIAVRGVLSLGEYRRAFEIETGGGSRTVWTVFHAVHLGRKLQVEYALPDDRVLSKYRSLHDQIVTVIVGRRVVLKEPLPYEAGWRTTWINTFDQFGSVDVRVLVQSGPTHFPVAFNIVVPHDH